jgi:hypothetical protein
MGVLCSARYLLEGQSRSLVLSIAILSDWYPNARDIALNAAHRFASVPNSGSTRLISPARRSAWWTWRTSCFRRGSVAPSSRRQADPSRGPCSSARARLRTKADGSVLRRGVIEKFALHPGSDARHQARTKQGLDPKLLRYPQIERLTLFRAQRGAQAQDRPLAVLVQQNRHRSLPPWRAGSRASPLQPRVTLAPQRARARGPAAV